MTGLQTRPVGGAPPVKPDFMMQTFIRTTQDRLWDALIEPDQVAAYHFIADAARPHDSGGHELLMPDGSLMLRMILLKSDPKTRLEFSFEPFWTGESVAASHAVMMIEPQANGICKLVCEHYDIPDALADDVREGWAMDVASLKSWLETGEPIKIDPEAA
ncbi:MAG: SRPBCC domain-containing protein [Pseudomonadota bacterium]